MNENNIPETFVPTPTPPHMDSLLCGLYLRWTAVLRLLFRVAGRLSTRERLLVEDSSATGSGSRSRDLFAFVTVGSLKAQG